MAMPPAQWSLFRTDNYVSLPCRPRRSFVRRAAVMQLLPVRARARTPSLPSESESNDGNDDPDDSGVDGEDEVAEAATHEARGASQHEDGAEAAAPAEREGNAAASSTASVPPSGSRKRSAPDADVGGGAPSRTPPTVRTPLPSDALAELLAARSRNPHIFPVTFWTPGTSAAVSAVPHLQASGALPSPAPQMPRGLPAAGHDVGVLLQDARTLSPSPPPPSASAPLPRRLSFGQTPTSPTPPISDGDGSSSDMHDDELVAAYITPPVSPTASLLASPSYLRPSSGKRHRSSGGRAARASRTAAVGAAAVPPPPPRTVEGAPSLTLDDLQDAIRNGFSSLRREMTRFRAELVVVKSQAASVLRRMDGLAATTDGMQSGNEIVLERLVHVEKALKAVGDRIPAARDGGDSWGAGTTEGDTVRVINEIKELFLEYLVGDIRAASSSASVYPTVDTTNARLLRAAAEVLKVSEEDAAARLQKKMMLPVRKPAKGMALVVAYQYVKRVVSHLSSSRTSVAVSTYVKNVHALKGMGTWSSIASSTRRILKLSPEECTELLRDDSFITGAYGRLAMLEALAEVIDEIEGTASMVASSGPNKASRVIRCLYGHFASVSFRVRSFPRNRAGLQSVTAGAGVLNQGHRSLFERELLLLHHLLPKDADVHEGLQLIDGADASRHLVRSSASSGTLAAAPVAPTGSLLTVLAAGSLPAAPAFALPDLPVGPVLPTPPRALTLAPLPAGVPFLPGSEAARREAERALLDDWDEEEDDDEIRPVRNEHASQWGAYRAVRR
ncbi:hypothetical protein BU14_0056s0049 [Porphyra umbilicalis]|uniref:Uncharacterized protein n=1 Tax=Porphyra umbilicalis TaxID=2786 RepID=A0A1X6PHG8_PORUM|nr:hypothetical protein BU14_0056s0049 [Porphyra umbilicalis]|eukprot:OSX80267.1 hypothetical protein BU14_0056s0049 [Porphyra umbilicalis]